MTSPYSSGGGGTHFEARVAATYLAAILSEAPARGLPAPLAIEVQTQRAAQDEPLDDIIIVGQLVDGTKTRLSLQVKSDIRFTTNDAEWIAVVQAAWDTVSKPTFDAAHHRVGVAIANYSAKIDKHLQSVLTWATHSADAADFFQRLGRKDFSHTEKRTFVDSIRTIIADHDGRVPADDAVWRFLQVFVILHFDINLEDRSRDAAATVDRLRDLLKTGWPEQAPAVWSHLVEQAGHLIPAGGSATRATIAASLASAGLPAGTPVSYRADIETLARESIQTLAQISDEIDGLNLFRASSYERLWDALGEARLIQIDGEPGVGKSALLKLLAQECARTGPIFVLKDRRIHPRGWSAHAHVLDVCNDPATILREFGCSGEPILFIDGIDKIDEPSEQVTVNDLIRTIANSECLERWRIVTTVRAQNLQHIETWLDVDALKRLGIATVTVEALGRTELSVIAAEQARLAPLLRQSGGLDVILSRPFFIDALLSLAHNTPDAQLPATEVELLQLWWRLGGSDRQDFSAAQHRRNALMQLAAQLASAPNKPLRISSVSPEAIAELKAAGVLRDKDLGHSVVFTHDIYEEWTLCEFLIVDRDGIVAALTQAKEPQALIRPAQLLGTYLLETEPSSDAWEALLRATADEALRPVWHRAVLTSCLQSTRAALLLEKLTDFLLADDAARLRRLLVAVRTIEVVPNPIFLNEKIFPDLEPADRVKMAEHSAIPKIPTWLRFLDWLISHLDFLTPKLIPDLIPTLYTWQIAWQGQNVRHCREIGREAFRWLQEFEEANYPLEFRDRRDPFGMHFPHNEGRDLESEIRQLALAAAGDVPDLASAYLASTAQLPRRFRQVRESVLANCGQLIRHLPRELVDFILAVFLEKPSDHTDPYSSGVRHMMEELGVAGHQSFYPASPAQPPFLALLRLHESEGIRLVKGICNHSIAIWRRSKAQPHRYAPAKPLPITFKFPWGKQTFWGDTQVYLWFRGIWGNGAVKSALMAQEQWALEAIEKGADFDAIFQKCIEGHESVGALGLGLSLCLAHQDKSIVRSFPLVTSPHVWLWDIARSVQDHRGIRPNEMGDWHRYRYQLQAVRTLNEKPHRGLEVRALVPYFVFWHDKILKGRYTRAIRRFTKDLPFEYEEQKGPEGVEDLRERMQIFSEQGDPRYWKAKPSPDGKDTLLYSDPPSLRSPKIVAQQQETALLNKASGVALWAQRTLENSTVDDRFTLAEGVALARELDSPDLFHFQFGPDDLVKSQSASAVSGAAYAFARHCQDVDWTPEMAGWSLGILERAATVVERDDAMSYRGSLSLMHPSVFAAHGYSSLIARAFEVRRAQSGLINLAVDALDDVVKAVFVSSKQYAAAHLAFVRILLVLGMKQCISTRADLPNLHSLHWDEKEANEQSHLIEWAENALNADVAPAFPAIPMPWIKRPANWKGKDKYGGFVQNELLFRYDLAEKILFEIDLPSILAEPASRAAFLDLLSNLVDWTIQEILPPFVERRRQNRDSNPPFEWIYAFAAWSGKLSAHLSAAETKSHALDRMLSTETDTALLLLQSFMRLFMIYAFLKVDSINSGHLALWQEITDWLYSNRQWQNQKGSDHLDREFQSCALAVLFCVHSDFGPLMCVIDEGWPHLPIFMPILERAVQEFGQNASLFYAVLTFFKRGGLDLLPEPGIGWLRDIAVSKKADQSFWESNGEELVGLLRLVTERRHTALTNDHRASIVAMADIMVDNGIRGAGFLQQELLRERS
ncbi:ATP-binding protein [Mycobacterium sp. KBS0706]|uniref:NACHT domain-containing protein n=1 Tax=Mycobacterium sp. KBS0706 TaxID=2578109 RepID=UPI00110F975E|nr:ATP-binding protein [Mycobacterium sp. KBS0706]TSD87573.1 ATP-binding protein [Mycobacterium sp. KBS0706]